MKLKELRQIASVDRLIVMSNDKYQLEVLPSQIAKHDEEEVVRVEAVLDTSLPSVNGSIQVTPCLQVCVLHQEE
jgi:hypothetical protein